MKAVIASKNNAKIEGARRALNRFYDNVEVVGFDVSSDVSKQPLNEEICEGAKNRLNNLKELCRRDGIDADFYMAIESGINNFLGSWEITNVAVVEDKNGVVSVATSPSFPVPEKYVEDIITSEFSQVMNNIFGQDDERRCYGGGIQLLTQGKVTRIDLTESAFIMALTTFLTEEWK